jgi:hypothetical protein
MEFHVFRCAKDRDYFVVTDEAHLEKVKSADLCITKNDELEKIGVFGERGEARVAFDEGLAKRSIEHQGYFRFEAKSFDPVAEWPISMP